ncbi:hypothetical protein [Janibacter indicus]|uniref:hypothetical protein n=1 Tax=Janibacter indicus TaxID=857417 RepID=UPI001179B696|nr:hypothetical protein [Janibacter indicus]
MDRLEGDEWEKPVAVVLDTNLWGKGHPDYEAIESLAKRLGKYEIPVWVPQQVAHEWVSHCERDLAALRKSYSILVKADAFDQDVAINKKMSTPEGVISRLGEISNVEVIPMLGESAVAALLDQIAGKGGAPRRRMSRPGRSTPP